jgi:hypothetical protein
MRSSTLTMIGLVAAASFALLAAACGGSSDTTTAAETTNPIDTVTTTASEPTPDPKDLVAQLSDLPSGYSVDTKGTGPRSLADALENATTPEHVDLIRRERVAGYESQFESTNFNVINCTATVYRSSDGAAEAFGLGNKRAMDEASFKPASLSESLGDEEEAYNAESGGFSVFVIVWRDRNVLGFCASSGLVPPDPAATIRVAQAQQARIAAALS